MKILIIEDEARIAKRIQRMTIDIFGDTLQSIKHVNQLGDASACIEELDLDLVLLDLNLNGENGFELLTQVVAGSFHTIVISAYKDQAITAFEYGVVDFVPKPFNRERLQKAFDRIVQREISDVDNTKYLAIKSRGKIKLILIEEVVYAKGAGVYSELHLYNGNKELHDKSLEKLEQLLSTSFERIHKSYLVKISEIKEIIVQSGSKYMAQLINGEMIPIGRTKYKDLKTKWS